MHKTTARNNTIDVFRLIACLFIIILHINYGTADSNLTAAFRLASRFGVPLFFMISGYFYRQSLNVSALNAFKKNSLKIISIIIIANLVYTPTTCLFTHHLYSIQFITVGNSLNLWYLYSLLIGTVTIYYLFIWKAGYKIQLGIIFMIVILALLTDSYSYILGNKDYSLVFKYFARPLLSIPFMLIGASFYDRDNIKKFISKKTGWILLVAGFSIQIIEVVVINAYTHRSTLIQQFLIGTFIYSIGVFILALSLQLKSDILSKTGRRYSLFIYLYHPLIIIIFHLLNYNSVLKGNIILLMPVAIFFIILFIGIFLDKYMPRVFLVLNGSIKEAFQKRQSSR